MNLNNYDETMMDIHNNDCFNQNKVQELNGLSFWKIIYSNITFLYIRYLKIGKFYYTLNLSLFKFRRNMEMSDENHRTYSGYGAGYAGYTKQKTKDNHDRWYIKQTCSFIKNIRMAMFMTINKMISKIKR